MNTSWDVLRTATSVCKDGKFKFCDLYGNGYNEGGFAGGLPFMHKISCASKPQRFSISCHKPWPRSSVWIKKYFCCLWLWREGLRRWTMWRQRNNYPTYNHKELLSSQSKPWPWQWGGVDFPQAPHKWGPGPFRALCTLLLPIIISVATAMSCIKNMAEEPWFLTAWSSWSPWGP